jgi:hypothetical protein
MINSGNIKIGFELEFEGVDFYDNERLLNKTLGKFGIIKEDGSLNEGFELASKIFRIKDFCGEPALEKWNVMFKKINDMDAHSASNTGNHFHVERAALTSEEIEKINYFIFSSQTLMDFIGERTENDWCYYLRNAAKQVKDRTGIKYRYLNVSKPDTIEFRFFKTPETARVFLKNIQFICSLIEFIKTNLVDKEPLYFRNNPSKIFTKYLRFVGKMGEYYPQLTAYFESNKEKFTKGDVRPDVFINCDLYPTQKVKQTLLKRFANTRCCKVDDVDKLLQKLNPEKAPKSINFLKKVKARAEKKSAERIYFENLDSSPQKQEENV